MRGGLQYEFGRDGAWWFTLVGVLGLLVSIELAYRAVKRNLVVMGLWTWGWKWLKGSTWREALRAPRNGMWPALERDGERDRNSAEEWNVELWQEMEQDPQVRELLRKMSGEYEEEEDNGSIKAASSVTEGEDATPRVSVAV